MTQERSPKKQSTISEPYAARRLNEIASRWDAKAHEWDRQLTEAHCHLNEDNAYVRFLEELDAILRVRQGFCADKGVIDAGCATGLVLVKAISSFAWGIGVDVSPKMIEAAQAKQIHGANFIVGDCFHLSNFCPMAGAVVSRGVLLSHYGPKQGVELLRSARACLGEGGFIVWDFLNQSARHSFHCAPENKAYFDANEVGAMATEAGFRVSKILGSPQRRVRVLLAEC